MSLHGMWTEFRDLVTGETDEGTLTSPSVSWIAGFGGTTSAGTKITEPVAEGLPAIYASIHVISETTGQLPLKLFMKQAGGGKRPAPEHPLYPLLHDAPNPEMNAFAFREMMTRHLALWGRAYADIQRDPAGRVRALWPLHPARMFVDRNELNEKRFRYWMGPGDYRETIHNPERPDIFHLHINCDDGVDGRSPLLINRESLGITKAAEEYTGAWFANGAIPGIVATSKGRLSPRAKENIRESWLKRFSGASRANKLAILEEGITVDVIGVDPEKSQLDKLRATQIEAAARIYRVPLFLIQSQSQATNWGTGIAEQMQGFVNLTLMPWFVQWQQAVKSSLLSPSSRDTYDALFVVNALVKGDIEKRFTAYQQARQNGWMNGNEIRELEDLNPIEGGAGSVYWQPANMLVAGANPTVVEDDATEPEPRAVDEPDGVM